MNLDGAKSHYRRAVEREIETRRLAFVSHMERGRRKYEQFIVPERPRGIFGWLFIGDYERCCFERQRLSERHESARVALSKFEAAITRGDEQLAKEIHQDAGTHCAAYDRRIMGVLSQERRRRLEERRLNAAVERFNDETGEEHRLAELEQDRFEKHEAVLFGSIRFDDSLYAKATPDRGRSFDLYPWDEKMQQHIGRACWFWFDREERSHFAPVLGTRGPVILGVKPLPLAPRDKNDGAEGASSV